MPLHRQAHRPPQELRVRGALHVHDIVDAAQAVRDACRHERLEAAQSPPALHGQGPLGGEHGGLLLAGGRGGGRRLEVRLMDDGRWLAWVGVKDGLGTEAGATDGLTDRPARLDSSTYIYLVRLGAAALLAPTAAVPQPAAVLLQRAGQRRALPRLHVRPAPPMERVLLRRRCPHGGRRRRRRWWPLHVCLGPRGRPRVLPCLLPRRGTDRGQKSTRSQKSRRVEDPVMD